MLRSTPVRHLLRQLGVQSVSHETSRQLCALSRNFSTHVVIPLARGLRNALVGAGCSRHEIVAMWLHGWGFSEPSGWLSRSTRGRCQIEIRRRHDTVADGGACYGRDNVGLSGLILVKHKQRRALHRGQNMLPEDIHWYVSRPGGRHVAPQGKPRQRKWAVSAPKAAKHAENPEVRRSWQPREVSSHCSRHDAVVDQARERICRSHAVVLIFSPGGHRRASLQ
jgi:hypothetical protein